MDITLVKMWNGLPVGYQLVGVQSGQAQLMIERGTAIVTQQVEQKQNPKRSK